MKKLKDDKEKERNAMKKKMEEREKNKGNAVAMGTALNGFSGDWKYRCCIFKIKFAHNFYYFIVRHYH